MGDGALRTAGEIATCTTVGHLDNGVDVDNEEQDQPVAVCRLPQQTWDVAWPRFRHLSRGPPVSAG